MANQAWTREQTLAALNLYCRTPFGRLHARNPAIVRLAAAIGRSPGAVAMKCCNFASLDPGLAARGIRGLAKVSKLDVELWQEFHRKPNDIGYESEQAAAHVLHQPLRIAEDVSLADIAG